ncbi:hypothetical protein B0H14DRAFT_2563768 [Mycena olivaceomarginata]|nr:hypothetical protein B0H14DRAFT_2563768 [Mycena olivaceomarginata]
MRTTLNILYACVSAIVASSWATARPNVPASHRQTFLITFYLIVFPEVVLTWALREYKDASVGKMVNCLQRPESTWDLETASESFKGVVERLEVVSDRFEA